GHREREPEIHRLSPDAILRLALVRADGRRRRHFGGVAAEDRAHAPAARDAPQRPAAAVIGGDERAVALLDLVGASLRDARRHLGAVAADEAAREAVGESDA